MTARTLRQGVLIQFPGWDETPGPTLIVLRIDPEGFYTRSLATGAVVRYPTKALRLAHEVRS